MGIIVKTALDSENLWMIFKVANNLYALNSDQIKSIGTLPSNITGVPDGEPYVRGITKHRGKVITLLEMRVLFDNQTQEEELDAFAKMLDVRKADHTKWVDTLDKSVKSGTAFPLATDPHKCAFGKWYDNFETNITNVQFHLDKIEEPHRLLHEAAMHIEHLVGEDKEEQRIEILQEAETVYMPKVIALLDETKEIIKDHFRDMMIVMESDNERTVAIIVDEIIGVERLGERYSDTILEKMQHSELLGGVALREQDDALLFLIDEEKIFQLGQEPQATEI